MQTQSQWDLVSWLGIEMCAVRQLSPGASQSIKQAKQRTAALMLEPALLLNLPHARCRVGLAQDALHNDLPWNSYPWYLHQSANVRIHTKELLSLKGLEHTRQLVCIYRTNQMA